MKKLAVLGASGHGKVVADTALVLGWSEIEFFDDAWPQKMIAGRWRVIGNTDLLLEKASEFDGSIVAIGDSHKRLEKFANLKNAGFNLVTLIHPNAVVSSDAEIGPGSVVFAGAIVNIDVVIGECVIVNTAATVDHDCILGNGVHIAPGVHLSGNVHVEAGSWLGVGSCVRQGIRIGATVTVGAGAVVVSDISDGLTVVGNPARPIC